MKKKLIDMKKICPICKADYRDRSFCPSCGLPWEVHFNMVYKECYGLRPEYKSLTDFQLCPFCETPNIFGAHFCRKCGKNIHTQATDKNGNGWVDLGLSVLWSTETLEGYYYWKDSKQIKSHNSDDRLYEDSQIDGKDAATEMLGSKWRTPTKEEFEELITKCKWEKSLRCSTHALKITGPNGNSIYLRVTGSNHSSFCGYWTSTAGQMLDESSKILFEGGYAFEYTGFKDFPPTLTKKQKLEREWGFSKDNDDLYTLSRSYSSLPPSKGNLQEWLKNQTHDYFQKRKILDEMGDDWRERDKNRKIDEEKRRTLWLETPIEMNLSNDLFMQFERTVRVRRTNWELAIRPVADKKWQGNL